MVEGETHRIPGPSKPAARDRLLEHFAARLEHRDPDTRPFVWTPSHAGISTRVRVRSGENLPRTTYERASALGLASVLSITPVAAILAVVAPKFLGWAESPWAGTAEWAYLAVLVLGAMAFASVLAATLFKASAGRRHGTISIDAHHLTVTAVDAQPLAMLWEDIESIGGDDQTLTLVVSGRRANFDLSAEPPEQVRGLLEELHMRWAKVQGASDQSEEAERRRQQLLGLIELGR